MELSKPLLCSDFKIVENWLNPGKCHLMRISKKVTDLELLSLNELILKNCREVEILGITLDRNLNFTSYIIKICRKVSLKLSALIRVSSYINTKKKYLLYKTRLKSQFIYCPIVWMFFQRQSNKLINKVHERALILIYQDNSNFKVLLEKQKEFPIHQRNLQVLITEIYKTLNDIDPPIMKSLFQFGINQYNLINFQGLPTEKRNTVNNGLEPLIYRTSAIWGKISPKYVHATSLDESKSEIKSWKCDICPSRLKLPTKSRKH